jgi:effector-binding domain-containing protein
VGHYEEVRDDGSVVLHAGFEIGDQEVVPDGAVQVVVLPARQVASVVHRGSFDGIAHAFEDLTRWVEDSGYQLAGPSRELYHETHEEDPTRHVTELQLPVTS